MTIKNLLEKIIEEKSYDASLLYQGKMK